MKKFQERFKPQKDLLMSLLVVELLALLFVIPVVAIKAVLLGVLAFTVIATVVTIIKMRKASYKKKDDKYTYRFPIVLFILHAILLVALTFLIAHLILAKWTMVFVYGMALLLSVIGLLLKVGHKVFAIICAFALMTCIILWAIFANSFRYAKDVKVDNLYVNNEYVTNQTVETQKVTQQDVDKSAVTEQTVETQKVTDQDVENQTVNKSEVTEQVVDKQTVTNQDVDNSHTKHENVDNQVVDTQVVIDQTIAPETEKPTPDTEKPTPETEKPTPETEKPAPETEKPVHTHNYASTVTEPTCTSKGYTIYTCSCGDSYKDSYKEALGHSYDTEVVKPTTTAGGYTVYTCKRCGHTYKDSFTDKLPEPKNPKVYVSAETMQKGDTVIVTIIDAEVSDVAIKYADPNTGAWTSEGVSLVHVVGDNYRLVVADSLFEMAVDVTIGLKSTNNYVIVTLEQTYN